MSQSLANIVVHLVFSTKGRRQLLRDEEDFQTEYRRFCEKNGKPVDERYVWD